MEAGRQQNEDGRQKTEEGKIARRCGGCGRFHTNCARCHHRSYCYYCNQCALHGQEEPSAELLAAGIAKSDRQLGRQWLVQVSFLTRRGWSGQVDVRVRAKGLAGATWHGVREARRQHLPRRTVVRQVKVLVIPA
jgi:late competence protein required for DNA uptake (superfamily II DNA/RNA helicase)